MGEMTEAAGLAERVGALEERHAQLDALATRGLKRLGDQQSKQLDRLRGELRRLRDELRDLAQRVAELEAANGDPFGLDAAFTDEEGTRGRPGGRQPRREST